MIHSSNVDDWFSVRSPPKIPEVHIPEEPILQLASGLRIEINRGLSSLREIASGRDLKKFLCVSLSRSFVVPLLSVLIRTFDSNMLLDLNRLYSACGFYQSWAAGSIS